VRISTVEFIHFLYILFLEEEYSCLWCVFAANCLGIALSLHIILLLLRIWCKGTQGKMKYVIVTSGVVSGKGITANIIGVVLKACGLRVTSIKIGKHIAY